MSSLTRYWYCARCAWNYRASYDRLRRRYDLVCTHCGAAGPSVDDRDLLTMPDAEHDAFLRMLARSDVPLPEAEASGEEVGPQVGDAIIMHVHFDPATSLYACDLSDPDAFRHPLAR